MNSGSDLVRLARVLQKTGHSRSALYAEIKKGTFPKPIALGARAVAWVESEVDDWVRQRIQASRRPAHLSASAMQQAS